MKKILLVYIAIMFTALIISSNFIDTKENKPNEIKATKTYNEKNYIVKYINNSVVVLDSSDKVIKTLDIDYNSLRDYDKEQLLAGIRVNDSEDIYQLTEDFTS